MQNNDDERLLRLAKNGDTEAESVLLARYKPYVEILSRPYFIVGADKDDLLQIGMIGLLKAVRTYETDKVVGFKTYAATCIRNAIFDGVREANAKKHIPLNSALSSSEYENGEPMQALASLPSLDPTPEEIILAQEAEESFYNYLLDALGEDDLDIFKLYLAAVPYKEISAQLGVTAKKVDNTIYNAKKKIEKIMSKRKN